MTPFLLAISLILILCVASNKMFGRIGVPMLLIYILLGMCFGADGIVKIPFKNLDLAEDLCALGLIFIMLYGGFGTKWSSARPVAVKAILLSSLGTILTACFVGAFTHYVVGFAPLESFLIGSVISSTDAASVFYILRSHRLNLKYNTASLLEVESGSNDPTAYMLTIVTLSLMSGQNTPGLFTMLILKQVVLGVAFGFGIAALTRFFLKHYPIKLSGINGSFMVAVALLAYAAPEMLGGNGYLSVYITGIVLGNSRINNKQELVHFFDGITGLMQMLLFFLLGLLCIPSQMTAIALPAAAIAVFLTFVGRPLAVFMILQPLKSPWNKQVLVSWAGMRGAASIVFAIFAVMHTAAPSHDIFHMVFFIVLFSILLQGSLLPVLARRLDMIDDNADVRKTFTDYIDETPVQFLQFPIPEDHPWNGMAVKNIALPPRSLIVMLKRGLTRTVPNGDTVLEAGDTLILSGLAINQEDNLKLYERTMEKGSEWINRPIAQIDLIQEFVILIKRANNIIIPHGDTVIQEDDVLVLSDKLE